MEKVKNNLIIQVANSFYWDESDKKRFSSDMKSHFKNYEVFIVFDSGNKTTFQILERECFFYRLFNFVKFVFLYNKQWMKK